MLLLCCVWLVCDPAGGALAAGAGVAFVGLAVPAVRILYNYAWFVGFLVSFLVYLSLMNRVAPVAQPAG